MNSLEAALAATISYGAVLRDAGQSLDAAMRKMVAAMNEDLFGPSEVTRTVSEEEVDFSVKSA